MNHINPTPKNFALIFIALLAAASAGFVIKFGFVAPGGVELIAIIFFALIGTATFLFRDQTK